MPVRSVTDFHWGVSVTLYIIMGKSILFHAIDNIRRNLDLVCKMGDGGERGERERKRERERERDGMLRTITQKVERRKPESERERERERERGREGQW